MMPLQTFFIGMMFFFGLIGALRGWAKELLVSFSVILARFIELVLVLYVPVLSVTIQGLQAENWFYVRLLIFIIIVSFGYATTVLSSELGQRARKEKFQDTLLGFFLGAINGYLVVGMIWGFIKEMGYGIWGITPPVSGTAAIQIVDYLPLQFLEGPTLFVAVAIAFAFVLIVFV